MSRAGRKDEMKNKSALNGVGIDAVVKAKIKYSIEGLRKLKRDYPWFNLVHPSIDFGHAEDSVRINGRERLTSFLDCIDGLEKLTPYLKDVRRRIDLSFKEIEKARTAFFGKYKRCPDCKGEHGHNKDRTWEDCLNCEGTGYVRK